MATAGKAPKLDNRESADFGSLSTPEILSVMLREHKHVSDLIFSPGRAPQVETHGNLVGVQFGGERALSTDDTRRIASDLIGNNKPAIALLREQGSCDVSYGLPGMARFRVNIFIQRGSCAVVMRVIPSAIPNLSALCLPSQLSNVAKLREGIVLVTGPHGSGKSSTLAAILDHINQEQNCHIITIEDPIEFLHNHKRATVHQRELHSDTPTMSLALRAALRQAPRVILVGEMSDRDTMDMVLQAAETGHLVLSSMNTVDAAGTIERIVAAFATVEQPSVRERLAKTVQFIISQRLIASTNGERRIPAVEILRPSPQTRACILAADKLREKLPLAIRAGRAQGMQLLDDEIEKMMLAGMIESGTALATAADPQEISEGVPASHS